ncbi:MAG: transcription elongation factor Spt5 [Candidatus Diapherotrites archaeon]|nr:transcription elongation factor Spt5 [Candidatus Diapherotrites archaeon]
MLFSVRTTVGQERIVADLLGARIRKDNAPVYSISVIDTLRGYIVVESPSEVELKKAVYGVPHIKGVVKGELMLPEVEHFFEEKPLTVDIHKGDLVELTSGPFKGERAKVIRVDDAKDKITVELVEATVPIPITLDAASIRVITQKLKKE